MSLLELALKKYTLGIIFLLRMYTNVLKEVMLLAFRLPYSYNTIYVVVTEELVAIAEHIRIKKNDFAS